MMSKKKKIGIITAIVVASFIIMGIVYALFSDRIQIVNKLKIGTLQIDDLNLTLKKENGDTEDVLEPADLDTISWTTKNVGTSGALTRHILEIYWKDASNTNLSDVLYLYPANLSKETILADFQNIQDGNASTYVLDTETFTRDVIGGTTNGIKYKFVGDRLKGSDNKSVIKDGEQASVAEVNYNSTDTTIIDTNISTDDTSETQDEISFRMLVSPKMSYLLQGKRIEIKVTTEAMQYTEDGSENWTVVDTITVTP